jgi:predicted RNA-binding protein with PUA-like domain
MRYWLLKSEPGTFGIDDLAASPRRTTCWDGVRNYQARNFIRDDMSPGDLAFFYHSNCPDTGIVGIVEIVTNAYPDSTALDPDDPHFDPKETSESPRWFMVDVRLERKLARTITLRELKASGRAALRDFQLLQRGSRLSVLPVTGKQWQTILEFEAHD